MDYEEIAYEVGDDGVAVRTLDRPDKLNAFTPTMLVEMIDALDRSDADAAVRAAGGHGADGAGKLGDAPGGDVDGKNGGSGVAHDRT